MQNKIQVKYSNIWTAQWPFKVNIDQTGCTKWCLSNTPMPELILYVIWKHIIDFSLSFNAVRIKDFPFYVLMALRKNR